MTLQQSSFRRKHSLARASADERVIQGLPVGLSLQLAAPFLAGCSPFASFAGREAAATRRAALADSQGLETLRLVLTISAGAPEVVEPGSPRPPADHMTLSARPRFLSSPYHSTILNLPLLRPAPRGVHAPSESGLAPLRGRSLGWERESSIRTAEEVL